MTPLRFALVLLAFAGQSESAIDAAQIDGLAGRWGERWYIGVHEGKTFFAGRLKATESTHDNHPCFSFEGEARIEMDKAFFAAKAAFLCRKNTYLSPLKFSCDVLDNKGTSVSFLSTFAEGKAKTVWGPNLDRGHVKEIPADLVHNLALLPLATAANFRKDATMKFTYYDLFDNFGRVAREDTALAYGGLEDLGNRKAHRIQVAWGRRIHNYWVSAERELVQFALAGGDFPGRVVLADEKTGKAALEELKAKMR